MCSCKRFNNGKRQIIETAENQFPKTYFLYVDDADEEGGTDLDEDL